MSGTHYPDPEPPKNPLKPGPLAPGLAPEKVVLQPPPPVERADNTEAEMALAFLKAGAPLQGGTPDDHVNLLAKIRKANK